MGGIELTLLTTTKIMRTTNCLYVFLLGNLMLLVSILCHLSTNDEVELTDAERVVGLRQCDSDMDFFWSDEQNQWVVTFLPPPPAR